NWVLPAHDGLTGDNQVSNVAHPRVDLFAAETGMVVAEAMYLLEPEMTRRAGPRLVQRLKDEINRRIITPVETLDDLWWFSGRNNWTPWCCFNTLGAAMYSLDDMDRLA